MRIRKMKTMGKCLAGYIALHGLHFAVEQENVLGV
jgi:hypothetical protein